MRSVLVVVAFLAVGCGGGASFIPDGGELSVSSGATSDGGTVHVKLSYVLSNMEDASRACWFDQTVCQVLGDIPAASWDPNTFTSFGCTVAQDFAPDTFAVQCPNTCPDAANECQPETDGGVLATTTYCQPAPHATFQHCAWAP